MTREQIIKEVENVLNEAKFAPKGHWGQYSQFKRRLSKLVGWNSDYLHFRTSDDFEAVMCRLVRILDLDDDWGMSRKYDKSELWNHIGA